MAIDLAMNATEVFKGAFEALPPDVWKEFYTLIFILKVTSIVFLVYMVVVVLRKLYQWFMDRKNTHTLSSIAKNIEEINQKLTLLVEKKAEKKTHGKDEKESSKEPSK